MRACYDLDWRAELHGRPRAPFGRARSLRTSARRQRVATVSSFAAYDGVGWSAPPSCGRSCSTTRQAGPSTSTSDRRGIGRALPSVALTAREGGRVCPVRHRPSVRGEPPTPTDRVAEASWRAGSPTRDRARLDVAVSASWPAAGRRRRVAAEATSSPRGAVPAPRRRRRAAARPAAVDAPPAPSQSRGRDHAGPVRQPVATTEAMGRPSRRRRSPRTARRRDDHGDVPGRERTSASGARSSTASTAATARPGVKAVNLTPSRPRGAPWHGIRAETNAFMAPQRPDGIPPIGRGRVVAASTATVRRRTGQVAPDGLGRPRRRSSPDAAHEGVGDPGGQLEALERRVLLRRLRVRGPHGPGDRSVSTSAMSASLPDRDRALGRAEAVARGRVGRR